MRSILFLLLALIVGGCVTVPKLPAAPDGERIVVSYWPGGPVCNQCESLEIVMTSDGRAVWSYGHGSYREWVEDRYRLRFSPEEFRKWSFQLAGYRPRGNLYFSANSEKKTCDVAYFDVPSRMIEWQDHRGTDRLVLDLGCDPDKHAKLLKLFEELPALVGIKNPPKADQWSATTRAQ